MGIIVDLFAGGGGASQGIYQATGRHPDIAVNHDPVAVAVHSINHPHTTHYCQDVWKVSPLMVSRHQPVDLLWASPDCTHHSKAKGGAPIRDEKRRDLAMVIVDKWVPTLKPSLIILENVEEFEDWGPLDSDGRIIKMAEGQKFREFINRLNRYGYRVEYRQLRACDYGAPTMRKRLYLIARCDGQAIVWPAATHGAPDSPGVLAGKLKPWRTAAECIDFSLPCPSIFATSAEIKAQYGLNARRPLKEATMRRIFRGLKKYVLDNPNPYVLPYLGSYYGDKGENDFRGRSVTEPLPTQTTENRFSLQSPYVVKCNHTGPGYNATRGQVVKQPLQTITQKHGMALVSPIITSPAHSTSTGRAEYIYDAKDPLRTITQIPTHALACANMITYHGASMAAGIDEPARTIMTRENIACMTSHLAKMRGTNTGQQLELPLQTITAGGQHFAEVRAFLQKYYGEGGQDQDINRPLDTITTKARFGLVTIHEQLYVIVDIGMRMLQPFELLLATGFTRDYRIDVGVNGKLTTKAQQVSLIGNAVCPDMAEALVRANYDGAQEGKHQRPGWPRRGRGEDA